VLQSIARALISMKDILPVSQWHLRVDEHLVNVLCFFIALFLLAHLGTESVSRSFRLDLYQIPVLGSVLSVRRGHLTLYMRCKSPWCTRRLRIVRIDQVESDAIWRVET
jgi:hypothetical protein